MAESVYIETPPRSKESESVVIIPFSQLDSIVKDKEFSLVRNYLKKHAVHWFDIGLSLQISKNELDVIEEDYAKTSRRLTEMIHAWLNKGLNCTWRTLFNAVRSLHQTEMVTIDVSQPSKIVIKEEKFQVDSRDAWVRKQRAITEQGATLLLMWKYVHKTYKNALHDLRIQVDVSRYVDEESFLKNSRLYPFEFRNKLFKIILEIPKEHIYLEAWGNKLVEDIKIVHDQANVLHEQGKNFKASEIAKRDCQKSLESCSQENAISKNLIDVKDILVQEINTCIKCVKKSLNKTKNLKHATNSFILEDKDYAIQHYVTLAIFFQICYLFKRANVEHALIYSLLSALFYGICLYIFGCFMYGIQMSLKLNPAVPFTVYESFLISLKINKSLKMKYATIFLMIIGALLTSFLEILTYLFEVKPIQPNQLTTVMTEILYTIIDYVIAYPHVTQDLLVGTAMGILGTKVASHLRHRMFEKLTVLAYIYLCLASFLFLWQFLVRNIGRMLMGITFGVITCTMHLIGCRILTIANVFRLFGLILISIILLVFISMGQFIGHLVSHHIIIRMTLSATGGAIGAVCSMLLTRNTKFPNYSSHDNLVKYTSTLDDAIHKLTDLQELLYQSKEIQ